MRFLLQSAGARSEIQASQGAILAVNNLPSKLVTDQYSFRRNAKRVQACAISFAAGQKIAQQSC